MAVGTDSDLHTHAEGLTRLVARACDGDGEAVEELVNAGYDRAFPVCRRVIGNDADAADATREALESVVRRLRDLDEPGRYVTVLYSCAVQAATSHTRRRSGRRRAPGSNDVSLIASESDLDSMVESIDVDLALMELPLETRVAVVLRDLCGLDYRDIGAVIAAPPAAVMARVIRGRGRLVELLDPAPPLG